MTDDFLAIYRRDALRHWRQNRAARRWRVKSKPVTMLMRELDECTFRLDCTQCGATQPILLPLELTHLSRIIRDFITQHRACSRPEHITIVAFNEVVCHHCGICCFASAGERVDIAAFVASHKACPEGGYDVRPE